MDNQDILLFAQEDKKHLDGTDPETQLILEGIAAFYDSNNARVRILMFDPLRSKVIPGITRVERLEISTNVLGPRTTSFRYSFVLWHFG